MQPVNKSVYGLLSIIPQKRELPRPVRSVVGTRRRGRRVMMVPVITVPVLITVMLDGRPNGSSGSQSAHANGGSAPGRHCRVSIAVRRA